MTGSLLAPYEKIGFPNRDVTKPTIMYGGKGRKVGVMGIPAASRAGVKKISLPCGVAALVGNVVEGKLEINFMSHRGNYLIRAHKSSGRQ